MEQVKGSKSVAAVGVSFENHPEFKDSTYLFLFLPLLTTSCNPGFLLPLCHVSC